jgi:hypothetical protein
MEDNLHSWGGRYNPIVPVLNNSIDQRWIEMIRHYDPDYVHYAKTIDVKVLKELNLFQPKQYIDLDENDCRSAKLGANIHYLLNKAGAVLDYQLNHNETFVAKEFFKLNLGFKPLYYGEEELLSGCSTIGIHGVNLMHIGTTILNGRPYFKTLLSHKHLDTIQLFHENSKQNEEFQLLIYEDNNYFDDLLYFWNRQLFLAPLETLNQVVISKSEFTQLASLADFHSLLTAISPVNQFYVHSLSLNSDELDEVIVLCQQRCPNIRFFRAEMKEFPFKVARIEELQTFRKKEEIRLLHGSSDFLPFNEVSFENNMPIPGKEYCLDLVIERGLNDRSKEIMFPYGTFLHRIVPDVWGRINKQHRISLFCFKKNGAEIKIPSDMDLFLNLLRHREYEANEVKPLDIEHITISDAGRKLWSFFMLFQENWHDIRSYMEDRFWVDFFQFRSRIKDSNIPQGKGVFSTQDIESEIKGIYETIENCFADYISRRDENNMDEALIKVVMESEVSDVIELTINPSLRYLVNVKGIFLGMKVKCRSCGSNKWYSLNELSNELNCKGCNGLIIPNIDSKIYYKVSEIISNNLLSDISGNGKEFHGNYIVLRTLMHLQEMPFSDSVSFSWAPCLDIWRRGVEPPGTDIDVVAIKKGELILGECKVKSSEFNAKEKRNLVWLADNVYPDKILIACMDGNLDDFAQDLKKEIKNKRCEVITYKIPKPRYDFSGLANVP